MYQTACSLRCRQADSASSNWATVARCIEGRIICGWPDYVSPYSMWVTVSHSLRTVLSCCTTFLSVKWGCIRLNMMTRLLTTFWLFMLYKLIVILELKEIGWFGSITRTDWNISWFWTLKVSFRHISHSLMIALPPWKTDTSIWCTKMIEYTDLRCFFENVP